jgi:hypothetical protein
MMELQSPSCTKGSSFTYTTAGTLAGFKMVGYEIGMEGVCSSLKIRAEDLVNQYERLVLYGG